MFTFTRGDKVCLVFLVCMDVSLGFWWGQRPSADVWAADIPATEVLTETPTPVPVAPSQVVETMAVTETADFNTNDVELAPDPNYGLWEHTYGDYLVRTVHTNGTNDEDRFTLQIFQSNTLVYTLDSWIIHDPESSDYNNGFTTNNLNLTGTGVPTLVIEDYSGGAHCCSTIHVFVLGGEFGELGTIDAEHGGVAFKDLDGDGVPEAVLNDWAYAYVFTCFAGSPAPDKVLRHQDGEYVAAPELNFTEPPTEDEFAALIEDVQSAYLPDPDSNEPAASPGTFEGNAKLWSAMLDLTYAGHLELAEELFEKCWKKEWPDKEKASDAFWDAVGSSSYGRAVVQAQGYDLPEPQPDPETKVAAPEISIDVNEKDSEQTYHVVDIGESLAIIAKKYEVSVEALMKANMMKPNQWIVVGQKLVIPMAAKVE